MFQYSGQPIKIQLPKAYAPFGVNNAKENPKNPSPVDKFSIQISFDSANKKLMEAKKFFDDLDQFNIDYITANSEKLLGTKKLREVIADAYEPMVKKSVQKKPEDPKYPDKMKLKLPIQNKTAKVNGKEVSIGVAANFQVAKEMTVDEKKVWKDLSITAKDDNDLFSIDWSWNEPRMHVSPIIECEGFYIVNKKIYCIWKVCMLRVYESTNVALTANSFRKDEDEDTEGTETADVSDKPVSEEEEYVEESDEE